MYFLVNHKKKVIFGWSAKCGCSYLKHYFYSKDIKEKFYKKGFLFFEKYGFHYK